MALEKHLRISWISGDVHAAGVGYFSGYHHHEPRMDPKFSLAVITSAIVNAPPPPAVINMLNKLAKKTHRSLWKHGTKEGAVPVFELDLNDQKQNDRYIMGARNWCAVKRDAGTGDLEFELRIEKSKGSGQTKSYPVKAPPPAWQVGKEHWGMLHSKGFNKHVNAGPASVIGEAEKPGAKPATVTGPTEGVNSTADGVSVPNGVNGAPAAAPTTAAAA